MFDRMPTCRNMRMQRNRSMQRRKRDCYYLIQKQANYSILLVLFVIARTISGWYPSLSLRPPLHSLGRPPIRRPGSQLELHEQRRRKRPRRQEETDDEYDNDYDDGFDDYYYSQEDYNNDGYKEQIDDPQQPTKRGGMYKVYFDDGMDVDPQETRLDWEVCRSVDPATNTKLEALVLLPPAAVERPTAILHFVGGTFFGSSPKLWYRGLLEGLVRNTQCAIVSTPIPVTLFKSPLDHIALCRQLRDSFQYACEVVLEDDYGRDVMNKVPVCGIGHSLGSRLLVVLETLSSKKNKRSRNIPYKSFVLMSFTNFEASAGVPGVSALLRQSKAQEQLETLKKTRDRNGRDERRRRRRPDAATRREQEAEQRRRRRRLQTKRDWWLDEDDDDDNYSDYRKGGYYSDKDNYYDDDYDDDDDDWEGLVDDLKEIFQEQADKVKSALTPKSEDLEFYPSPDQLWKAVSQDRRFSVPETLLVQFDDDAFDQSSKLAQILLDTNSSDVKFTRMRGNHLSPISVSSTDGMQDGDNKLDWQGLSSQASKTMWELLQKGQKSNAKTQEATLAELRQSIARYITDVVTK